MKAIFNIVTLLSLVVAQYSLAPLPRGSGVGDVGWRPPRPNTHEVHVYGAV